MLSGGKVMVLDLTPSAEAFVSLRTRACLLQSHHALSLTHHHMLFYKDTEHDRRYQRSATDI